MYFKALKIDKCYMEYKYFNYKKVNVTGLL